jgi:hypothetical protein
MTGLPKVKIVGQRGSWFVDTPYGRLAVVHKYHWRNGVVHFHPAAHAAAKGIAASRNHDFMDTLRVATRVVVSDDEVIERNGVPVEFIRKGYVGVYQIGDFKEEPNGDWSFRYVRREANAA